MKDKGRKIVREGSVGPSDSLTRKLVAFEIPVGTTSIQVSYSYTGRQEGNAIDLGLLGIDGIFKGYSGGSKTEITVANDRATPGYIPGLIQPGQWQVLLGVYSVVQPATYHVEITLGDDPLPVFTPSAAPTIVRTSGSLKLPPGESSKKRWLKGDLHMHTLFSDGHFTLDELVTKAQDRGLDFIFSTEHNTYSANLTWGRHATKDLLVGRGIEVTTQFGHWNALGLLPEQYIDPIVHDRKKPDESLLAGVDEVHAQNGLAIINHPYAECKCCSWDFSFHDNMDAIEVWNGPWRRHPKDESNVQAVEKWDALLREGKVFAASGGSDIHEDKFEIAEPCTRVLAEENSTECILRNIRERRVYLTRHPKYEVVFELRCGGKTAGIGDWLEIGEEDQDVTAKVELRGFDSFELRIISDDGVVHSTSDASVTLSVRGKYVRVEVRDGAGEMLGLTNPIWIIKR